MCSGPPRYYNLINRQAGYPLNLPPPRAARLFPCLCAGGPRPSGRDASAGRTSPSGELSPRICPKLPGLRKNVHVAYRLDASNLVRSLQALALGRRDKGKPAARRGRKTYGPPRASLWEVAGLSDGGGGTTMLRLQRKGRKGEGAQMQPHIKHSHMRLVLHDGKAESTLALLCKEVGRRW